MADDEKMTIEVAPGEDERQVMAQLRISPVMRHATIINALSSLTVKGETKSSGEDVAVAMKRLSVTVADGNSDYIRETLLSQSVTLDVTSNEMMRRAWLNVAEYPEAFHRYMNLALKMQAQSRATMEALIRLDQPREQTVVHKHIYVGPNGQAVVADEFHHHGPGAENARIAEQAHATVPVAALPGADSSGHQVSIARSQRKETMPNARRGNGKRGTARQSQRAQARSENAGDV